MGRVIALSLNENNYLDGRTLDGTVGLAPSLDGYSGTRWSLGNVEDGVTLFCLGYMEGPSYLDGRTADGTVGLAPDTGDGFSGTRWQFAIPPYNLGGYLLKCMGNVPGPRWLSFVDGTIRLTDVDAASATRWNLTDL